MGFFPASTRPAARAWAAWLVPALVACGLAGCGGEGSPTLILSIRAPTTISVIDVFAKHYDDDGGVALYPVSEEEVPAGMDGYVLSVGTDPLQMRIDLPEPGRYAVHLVGVPAGVVEADPTGDRYVATVCAEVTGIALRDDVVLGRLTRGPGGLDVDGDNFPEDADAFCATQADAGLGCDTSCNVVEYLAMVDCNPGPEFVLPVGSECDTTVGDPQVWNPFAPDPCGDCLDQDCYGGDARCLDRDQDGYPENLDCDDHDPGINPGALEACGNGIDENCDDRPPECSDGDLPCDADGDRYLAECAGVVSPDDDCDDTNAAVNPGAYEGYGSDPDDPTASPGCGDGVDDNCDGRVDERCSNDLDDDGVERDTDCNDCNAAVGRGLEEVCGNGLDEDCDGTDLACDPSDADGDGVRSEASGGADCDDSDPTIHAGAADHCGDGIGQDCSLDRVCGDVTDADGDRFAADGGDCDDADPGANPWATEVCDEDETGTDEDCDGIVNEVPAVDAGERGCGYDEDGDRLWEEIDYATDIDHCGRCHHECVVPPVYAEGDACVDGACSCTGEEGGAGCAGGVDDYCCPDGCQALGTDTRHCGTCDIYEGGCVQFEQCVPDESNHGLGECLCMEEAIAVRCHPSEYDACCPGLGCTDTTDDVNNCGECEFDCHDVGGQPMGDICAGSTCYCGAIGTVCSGSAWCTDVSEPPKGLPSCGCADLLNGTATCGRCDHACDPNEVCQSGACRCEPAARDCEGPRASACCPGASSCVDLDTDESHCGTCGNACRAGEECVGGACVCGTDCHDGVDCTEDACVGGRCEQYTLDADNDGWCAPGCDDEGRGDCEEGDCDDDNEDANPDEAEKCSTAFDDDCDGGSNDLSATGCTTYYLDADDDTYGTSSTQCRCRTQGDYTATRSGDCNDGNGNVNPAEDETCNAVDDDCSGSTADGADECSGGAAYCCGSTPDCRTCCTDDQCPGSHPDCTASYTCGCASGWTGCGGTCNCNTGGDYCCGGSTCVNTSGSGAGTGCCSASDCGGTGWSCTSNACSCSGVVCSGNCYAGGTCCDDAGCPGANDHCNVATHTCACDAGWFGCPSGCSCNTCCNGATCWAVGSGGGYGEPCCDAADCIYIPECVSYYCYYPW